MPARAAPDRKSAPPLFEFANVSVIRGDKRVLDHVTLSIAEGENVAILGPNGAGKSSLIKTITREYYPVLSEGPVTFRYGEKMNGMSFASGRLSASYQTTSSIPSQEPSPAGR